MPKSPPLPIPRVEEATCGLLVIDLQEKFAPVIQEWPSLLAASARLIHFFRLLKAPIGVTEQYPKGLGATVPEIQAALAGTAAWQLSKTRFSSVGTDDLMRPLEQTGRRQWILCGIETHVCLQQTALDLLAAGREVFVAADAAGSRRTADREAALARMARAGAVISTSEALIFEILRDAGHPLFKQASALVKA